MCETTPILETLVNQGQLHPVFGFAMDQSNPELILGGRATSRISGEFIFIPVHTGIFVRISRGVVAFILTWTR